MAKKAYSSKNENGLVTYLRSEGIEPTKRGWPDFWWIDSSQQLHAVECKRAARQGTHGLYTRHQAAALEELTALGVETHLWRNAAWGLEDWRRGLPEWWDSEQYWDTRGPQGFWIK